MNFRNYIDILAWNDVAATGTSEGAKKAWDEIGRKTGQFTGKQKQEFKQKGMLIPLKPKGAKYTGTLPTKRNILEKTKVAKKGSYLPYLPPSKDDEYYHSIVRPYGIPMDGPKGPVWSGAPPNKEHPEKGTFTEFTRLKKADENRVTMVYDSRLNHAGGGTTVFINKERTGPTSSRVGLVEVGQSENSRIESTKATQFKSSKAARDFLRMRYGIDVRWGTAKLEAS